jgi:hypothetical protein
MLKIFSTMPLDFVRSNKGGEFLVVNGHTFRQEKIINEKRIWKCTEYRTSKCKSRCHSKDDILTKQPTEHNHVPDLARIKAKKIMDEIKKKAKTTQESTHHIAASASVSEEISVAVTVQLPKVANIKQTIRRVRHAAQAPLPNPTNLEELDLPEEYTKTLQGENFLLFDSGPGPQRILIFSTTANMDLLASCPNWYADGTFKTTPPLFQQIYTIHVLKYKTVIPLVFILMSDRSTTSYVRVLSELNNLHPGLNPSSIMTDFEHASILAFRRIFPNIQQQGCLFHLSQCIWRRIQQVNPIQQRYMEDPDYAFHLRQLAALAFIPPPDVVEAFEELTESQFFVDNEEELRNLINYFEDTWIGRPTRRGGRGNPVFSIEMWNCYNEVLNDLPKTNNSVEGWHRGFSQLLGAYHPTIWKFINGLQQEQSFNELKLEQYSAGQQPPPGKKVYREVAKRIKTVVQDYTNRTRLDYLRGIAQNLSLHV